MGVSWQKFLSYVIVPLMLSLVPSLIPVPSWLIVDKEEGNALALSERDNNAIIFLLSLSLLIAPLLLLFHVAEKSIRHKRRIMDDIKERESDSDQNELNSDLFIVFRLFSITN